MNQPSRLTGHTARTPDRDVNEAYSCTVATPTIDQIIGFRIMRETEIAPNWWARPVEIGETVSATVAVKFCDQQNVVTMNPNRDKRQRYSADPIYAAPTTPARPLIAYGVKRGTGRLVVTAVAA